MPPLVLISQPTETGHHADRNVPRLCTLLPPSGGRLGHAVRRTGVAVVASLVDLAATYADRIIALRAGHVVEDAPARRLDERALELIYVPGTRVGSPA